MEPDPEPQRPDSGADIEVQRVRAPASTDRLTLAAGIVGLIVALAILKPWGDLGTAPSAPPRVFATDTPAPSAAPRTPSPEDLAGPVCLGAGGWQVASLETWRTQDVRVWRALEPALDATGPLDSAIPIVPIIALDVRAIGFCAPAFGPDEPVGPASIAAWSIVGGKATEVALLQVVPENGVTPLAGLYRPIERCLPAGLCSYGGPALTPGWPAGRVVFRHDDEGTGRATWFAVDLQIVPGAPRPDGSPAPKPSPAG